VRSLLAFLAALGFAATALALPQEIPAAAEPPDATPTPTPAATPTPSPAPSPSATPISTRTFEEPVEVAYYYKVRWGFQPEFERLYYKNHFPILMAQKKSGRIRDVRVYRPTFHGDGRADWTFLVVIKWAGWTELGQPSQEETVARQIFPDFRLYQKEEQRRFEIVEAHWDVPLKAVDPPQ
jgi:hypothetical protein